MKISLINNNKNILQFGKHKQTNSTEEKKDEVSLKIDISSSARFPYCILSNFAPTNFVFDGVVINSMEGFLQSLKVNDDEEQKKICKLVGIKAKSKGKKLNEQRKYDFKYLYWQGKYYDRTKPEYTDLLKRAYKARYSQDMNFLYALDSTKGRILSHSLGEKDKNRTILSEQEFTDILTELRDNNNI